MSHKEETTSGSFRIYMRLMSFTKPYWKMLTIGVLCGILVGGSLFVALMMIPRLVDVAETSVAGAGKVDVSAKEIVRVCDDNKNLSEEEKCRVVNDILHPQDSDPQLTKMIEQAKKTIKSFHLPCEIEKQTVFVHWPKDFSFDIVNSDGRVAWQLFAGYAIAFLLAWLVKCIAKYINGYYTRRVGAQVVVDLREKLFQRLTGQSLSFYGQMDVGQLLSRCTNDTQALEYSISHSVEDLTSAPVQILACIIAIFVACKENNSYTLAIILFVGMPLLLLPMRLLGRSIRTVYRKSFARIAIVITRMHETFSGIKVVKACNTEAMECRRFHASTSSYLKQVFRALRLQQLVSPTMEFVSVLCILVFIIFAYNDGVTVTELMALLAPAFMAARPIKDLSKVIVLIQQSMAAADRYFELLDDDQSLPEKADAVEMTGFNDSIKIEDVVFRYDEREILSHINFEIKRGQTIAVVGETGSGKSTLANLIARFYDVTSGRITFDGVDVRDYSIASLRRQIGVVTQDPVLFNESIAANIAYGNPGADREAIVAAAKLANAHEFIVGGNHSEGYDTIVGEKGFKLSGGEKQRISIARVILKNPPIIILDEATSALDTVTEKLVQDALNKMMTNRTVFVIAHRLSTIRDADIILVMSNGKIAEYGSHQELLDKNGIYRRLYDTQFENK